MEELTDEQTGVRITIERDIPEYPMLTMYPADGVSLEDTNDAVRRLMKQVGLAPDGKQPYGISRGQVQKMAEVEQIIEKVVTLRIAKNVYYDFTLTISVENDRPVYSTITNVQESA